MSPPGCRAIGRVAEARLLILAGIEPACPAQQAWLAAHRRLARCPPGWCMRVVCALQGLASTPRRAWTMHGTVSPGTDGSVHTAASCHRAAILRLRGQCPHSETEVLGACEERGLSATRTGVPLKSSAASISLNDVPGRNRPVAAHRAAWSSAPGLPLCFGVRATCYCHDLASAMHWRPLNGCSKEQPPATDCAGHRCFTRSRIALAAATSSRHGPGRGSPFGRHPVRRHALTASAATVARVSWPRHADGGCCSPKRPESGGMLDAL